MKLQVDPARQYLSDTGIYVRAQNPDGKWGNADIAHLTKDSLDGWLRSRDSIDWPIGVVMILLGHQQ